MPIDVDEREKTCVDIVRQTRLTTYFPPLLRQVAPLSAMCSTHGSNSGSNSLECVHHNNFKVVLQYVPSMMDDGRKAKTLRTGEIESIRPKSGLVERQCEKGEKMQRNFAAISGLWRIPNRRMNTGVVCRNFAP